MYSIEAETARSTRLYPVGDTFAFAQVHMPETWVFDQPDATSARQTQYTYGESLRLLAESGDFYLAQSLRDAYSGWVAKNALTLQDDEPQALAWRTRSVAPVTRDASMKSPHLTTLPPDACLPVDDEQDDYLHIAGLGWLHRHHAIRTDRHSDIVMPYKKTACERPLTVGRQCTDDETIHNLRKILYKMRTEVVPVILCFSSFIYLIFLSLTH